MPSTRTTAEHVPIAEIKVGDKLLSEIVGYKNRTLFHRGHVFSVHDMQFFKKKLAETKPKLASMRFKCGRKTPGDIKAANGNVLVPRGKMVTAEALAPLLKEGFTVVEDMDQQKIFSKPQEWPKDVPFNIAEYNPTIVVETTLVDGEERKKPAGAAR